MKRFALVIIVMLLFSGCGASSDDFKNYKSVRVERNGTISLLDEIGAEEQLPQEYHKVYFKKDGRVTKEHLIISGKPKRSSMYIFNKNGKIEEIRYFEKGKYSGVSRYSYLHGSIDKEKIYDKNLKFMFSRKFKSEDE